MSYGQEITSSGFLRVGQPATIGGVILDYGTLNELRDYVAQSFFDTVQVRTPVANDYEDKTSFVKHHSQMTETELESSRFVSLLLRHRQDAWRLAIMKSELYRSSWNNGPQRVAKRYKMETLGGAVLEACKEVRIIRTVGYLSADSFGEEASFETQRRVYERQMTGRDCTYLRGLLAHVSGRIMADGR